MRDTYQLTHDGVTYVPGDEALIRISGALKLSISGAYRRLKAARAAGDVRVILVSRNQRWFALPDIESLICKEQKS